MAEAYDVIGLGYAGRRRADPRIARPLRAALGASRSVLNVGAGTGNYEPPDLAVIAVEPSLTMIRQRPATAAPAVRARAEALPFADKSFDAVQGVLTLHHWTDLAAGLAECARCARRLAVFLTIDPAAAGAFWLVRDYFPDINALDRATVPSLAAVQSALGPLEVATLEVPADCADGFLGAYWRRPEAYLDPAVRASISVFSRIGSVERRIERLRRDLASGRWARRQRDLLGRPSLDLGYRLVTARLG